MEQNKASFVYCLSIDLIGSTKAGIELTTSQLERFNRSLIEQINPHIKELELNDVLVKFTGDGWLLMTDDIEMVPKLCCLAKIMANNFQREMSQKTGILEDRIPPLRLAICSGRDVSVELLDKRRDWVGDSARRATRASGYCYSNEILIDEPVRCQIFRDFEITSAEVEDRPAQPKKVEEQFPIYILGNLKPEAAADSESADYFVYMLSAMGKEKTASEVAQQGIELIIDKVKEPSIDEERFIKISQKWNRLVSRIPEYPKALEMLNNGLLIGISPNAVAYNALIYKSPDYDEATYWLERMIKECIRPNVVTYNIIIYKSPDYDEAKSWLERMVKEGIQPNIVTYSTLISKAPDYDEARSWLERMVKEGIQPDIVTYNTLISIAPDYDEARSWLERMVKEGIQPNIVTYNTLISIAPDYDEAMRWFNRMHDDWISPDLWSYQNLFKKDLSDKSADDILEWYLSQQYHPEEAVQAAITAYRKCHRIDQALRLSLDYPHLQSARKVIRSNKEYSISYFKNILDESPSHPNAHYALGVAFMEFGQYEEAKHHLEIAYNLSIRGRRKTVIETWLRQIDQELSKN